MIQIGDYVKIKSIKRLEKEFGRQSDTRTWVIPCGSLNFIPEMERFCGMVGKVIGFEERHICLLHDEQVLILDNPVLNRQIYAFTNKMVYKLKNYS